MNQSQPTRGPIDFDTSLEAEPAGLKRILKSIEDGSFFRRPCMRNGKSSRSQKSSYSTMEILRRSKSIEYGSFYGKPCMREGKSSGSQKSSYTTMEKAFHCLQQSRQPRRVKKKLYMDSKVWKIDSRSKKRRQVDSSLPFLSEEIIMNILVWLPADILYNVISFVCRGWYNIIRNRDFIQANLLQSTAGLFIQSKGGPYSHSAVFANVEDCDIQIRKVGFEFPSTVYASCDGLILFWYPTKWLILGIANPVTKQRVTLPPLPYFAAIVQCRCGFVYAPSLRRYKVVNYAYFEYLNDFIRHLYVVTVGADKVWRKIDVTHIPLSAQILFDSRPYSIGKFIYWARSDKPDVLALDMESEIISQLPVPIDVVMGDKCSYEAMGGKLCLMYMVATLHWQVWVLDMELGQWVKLFNLDLRGQISIFERLIGTLPRYLFPTLWLRNGEVAVFPVEYPSSKSRVVVHNVKTGVVGMFETKDEHLGTLSYLVHANSLVSLKLCC